MADIVFPCLLKFLETLTETLENEIYVLFESFGGFCHPYCALCYVKHDLCLTHFKKAHLVRGSPN